MCHPIETYISRYPQLSLPIRDGMSQSEAYRQIVRKGIFPKSPDNPFHCSPRDRIFSVDTPVGSVPVLYLYERSDFVRFVQVMSHRCEPIPVPASMGAVTYLGLTNWNRIHAHKREYLLSGNQNWSQEFKVFTADPGNYKDTVIVVSEGPYSALPAADAGMDEASWCRISLIIRSYHELTHLICRQLWAENKHPFRDELVADCIGLLAGFGRYDRTLAANLLGFTDSRYRMGGRLQNYLPTGVTIAQVEDQTNRMLDLLDAFCQKHSALSPFQILELIESQRLGMDIWIGFSDILH